MSNTRALYRRLFKKARKEKWAIGQFNVGSFEVLQSVVSAAYKMRSPILIGTSEGESSFLGLSETVALVRALEKKMRIPILLNLDHAHTLGYIRDALKAGYDSVHFDGSRYSFQENIKIASRVVALARRYEAHVEGEIEKVPGSSHIIGKAPQITPEHLTDPHKVHEFVQSTNVDRVAVNIGTFHGMSSSRVPPKLQLSVLSEIATRLPSTSLVLHGASGTKKGDVKKAIARGITKVNVNTELRLAFRDELMRELKSHPKEIVPYRYFVPAMKRVEKEVQQKITLFGSAQKI